MKTVVKGLNGKVSLFDTYSIIDTERHQPLTDRIVLGLFKDGSYNLVRYVDGEWLYKSGESAVTPPYWVDIPRYNKIWAQERKTETLDSKPKVEIEVKSWNFNN